MKDTTEHARAAPSIGGLGPQLTALLLDVPAGLVYWDRARSAAIIRDDLGVLPMRGGARLMAHGLVELAPADRYGIPLALTDKGRKLVERVQQDHL